MIILTLGGGLGNQMFEYAFARALQFQSKQNGILLNTFHVVKYESNKEALHNLCLPPEVRVCNRFEKNIYKYLEKIKRRYLVKRKKYQWNDKQLFYNLSIDGIFYNLQVFSYDDYQIPITNNIYIYGVYQNPHYWWEYKEIIKQELKVKTLPSKENSKMLSKISQGNSICVHIRRGDYVTNPRWKGLNICGEDYYCRAMEYINEQVKDSIFYIFSNSHSDIEWIQKEYNLQKYNVVYVDLNNPDYEELRLMYSCKHFIIANSTFSWWAQFLSDSNEKIVCAPRFWAQGLNCQKELYEDNWKIIDC